MLKPVLVLFAAKATAHLIRDISKLFTVRYHLEDCSARVYRVLPYRVVDAWAGKDRLLTGSKGNLVC